MNSNVLSQSIKIDELRLRVALDNFMHASLPTIALAISTLYTALGASITMPRDVVDLLNIVLPSRANHQRISP